MITNEKINFFSLELIALQGITIIQREKTIIEYMLIGYDARRKKIIVI